MIIIFKEVMQKNSIEAVHGLLKRVEKISQDIRNVDGMDLNIDLKNALIHDLRQQRHSVRKAAVDIIYRM